MKIMYIYIYIRRLKLQNIFESVIIDNSWNSFSYLIALQWSLCSWWCCLILHRITKISETVLSKGKQISARSYIKIRKMLVCRVLVQTLFIQYIRINFFKRQIDATCTETSFDIIKVKNEVHWCHQFKHSSRLECIFWVFWMHISRY